MSNRYRIGDLEKLFKIPAQNIRFYEKKGILSPQREPGNLYRTYSDQDLYTLATIMFYRQFDFTLKETADLMKTDSLEEVSSAFASQITCIWDKIQEYQRLFKALSDEQNRIQSIRQMLGSFALCYPPQMIFQRHKNNNNFQSADGNENFGELGEYIVQWLNGSPEAYLTFYIQADSLKQDTSEDIDVWYGASIEVEKARVYGIKTTPLDKYLPVCSCLYTIFDAYDEQHLPEAFYHSVYKEILQKGYVINGNPFGRSIIKAHNGQQPVWYLETWVPIVQ